MKSKLVSILRESNNSSFVTKESNQNCYFVDSNIGLYSMSSYDSKYKKNVHKDVKSRSLNNDNRYIFKDDIKSEEIKSLIILNDVVMNFVMSLKHDGKINESMFNFPSILMFNYSISLQNNVFDDFCFGIFLTVSKLLPVASELSKLNCVYYLHLIWMEEIMQVIKVLPKSLITQVKLLMWKILPIEMRKYVVLKKSSNLIDRMIEKDIMYLNSRCKNKNSKVITLVNVYDKVKYVPFEKYATQAKRDIINDNKTSCDDHFSGITYKNFGNDKNECNYLEKLSKFCVIMKIKLGIQDKETALYLNELLITKDDVDNFDVHNITKYNIEIGKYKENRNYLFENSFVINFEEAILKKDIRSMIVDEIIEMYLKKILLNDKKIIYFDYIHSSECEVGIKYMRKYENESIFVTFLKRNVVKNIIPIMINECHEMGHQSLMKMFGDYVRLDDILMIYDKIKSNVKLGDISIRDDIGIELYLSKDNLQKLFEFMMLNGDDDNCGDSISDDGVLHKMVFVDNYYTNKVGEGEMAILNWIRKFKLGDVGVKREAMLYNIKVDPNKNETPSYMIVSKDTDVVVSSLIVSKIIRRFNVNDEMNFDNKLFVEISHNKNIKTTNVNINQLYYSILSNVIKDDYENKMNNNFVVESYICAMMICGGDYINPYYGINHAKIEKVFNEYYELYGDLLTFEFNDPCDSKLNVCDGDDEDNKMTLRDKIPKLVLHHDNYKNLLMMAYYEGEKSKKSFKKKFKNVSSFVDLNWNEFQIYMEKTFVKSKYKHPPSQEIIEQQILSLEWNLQYYINVCFDIKQPNGVENGCYKYIYNDKGYVSGNVVPSLSPLKMEKKRKNNDVKNDVIVKKVVSKKSKK